jgi:thymidylate synthase (FAD)
VEFAEPEVHLIARPAIDWDALGEYLGSVDQQAADWLRERMTGVTASDGENLVEAAHRACERYWGPGPNPAITKVSADRRNYLQEILRAELGTVLEHANYTFAFRNISRVTVDALAHHRAGTAASPRRKPLLAEEIRFWLPDWAREDQALLEGIKSHLARQEEFQDWLRKHLNFHDIAKSWPRKKTMSAFTRWFTPQGAATDLIWTANIRALRTIIGAMTAPDAEEASRVTFSKVAQIMRAECPVVFS